MLDDIKVVVGFLAFIGLAVTATIIRYLRAKDLRDLDDEPPRHQRR